MHRLPIKNRTKKFLEASQNNVTVLITLLVVSAVFNTQNYYQAHYNFDILPYISPTEIISLSFLSLGKISLPSVLLGSLFLVLYFAIPALLTKKIEGDIETYIDLKEGRANVRIFWVLVPPCIFLSVIFVCIFFNIYPPETRIIGGVATYSMFYTVIAMSTLLLSVGLVIKLIEVIQSKIYIKFSITNYIFLIICQYSAMVILCETKREAYEVKQFYKYYGTIVQAENEKYVSDSLTTYIGRTSSAVFVYNFRDHTVKVIPNDKIVYLQVKSKKEFGKPKSIKGIPFAELLMNDPL